MYVKEQSNVFHILYIVRPVRFLSSKFTQKTVYPLATVLLILVIDMNKDNLCDKIFFFCE